MDCFVDMAKYSTVVEFIMVYLNKPNLLKIIKILRVMTLTMIKSLRRLIFQSILLKEMLKKVICNNKSLKKILKFEVVMNSIYICINNRIRNI